jgi:chemotaxis protein methyltransferase CheR
VVRDTEGVAFLQESLPKLGLRWRGFRKVRRLIYRRLERRLAELQLPNLAAYSSYLAANAREWTVLDSFCRIPVSRFYRDRRLWEFVTDVVLPALAATVIERGATEVRCWSAGCACGEEPYTLAIVWRLRIGPRFPTLQIHIVATDVEPEMIRGAMRACYPSYVVRDLPAPLRAEAFTPTVDGLRLDDRYRRDVEFLVQDLREVMPAGTFDLILCRYVAFTYFDDAAQSRTLATLVGKLAPGGALVIGPGESLPRNARSGLVPWAPRLGVYRALTSLPVTSSSEVPSEPIPREPGHDLKGPGLLE